MSDIIYYPSIIGPLIIFALGLFVILYVFEKTKSRRYREDLSNLYVAAKIREVAGKEGINLAQEYESFKKWRKKDNIENKSLDCTIEAELQDKVTDGMKKDSKKPNLKMTREALGEDRQ